MLSLNRPRSVLLGFLMLGLAAGAGCQSVGSATPTPRADSFAVVRATAEAAYQQGKQQLARGELEAALVNLDSAKVHDPDNRADIQSALDQTLAAIRALPPEPTAAPRPIPALPTVAPFSLQPPTDPRAAGTAEPPRSPAPALAIPSAVTLPLPPSPARAAAAIDLRTWEDPAGMFALLAPSAWQTSGSPRTTFGRGVISFRDPSGAGTVDVAEDTAEGVSPELYAARIEIQMQQQPGYASESVLPSTTDGNPSLRRNFVVTTRDADGNNQAARGFQLVLVHSSTAYVLSALAPAVRYDEFAATFDRMAGSFTVH